MWVLRLLIKKECNLVVWIFTIPGFSEINGCVGQGVMFIYLLWRHFWWPLLASDGVYNLEKLERWSHKGGLNVLLKSKNSHPRSHTVMSQEHRGNIARPSYPAIYSRGEQMKKPKERRFFKIWDKISKISKKNPKKLKV